MSVLLPSSTEPIVANRRRSMVSTPIPAPPAGGEPGNVVIALEVALALAVLHCGLGEPVVGPRGAALRDARRGHLADDLVHRVGVGADGAGASRVTDGAEPDGLLADVLAVAWRHPLAQREQHAVPLDDLPLVRVVDGRELDLFPADVLPDVE